jgi:protein CpxP
MKFAPKHLLATGLLAALAAVGAQTLPATPGTGAAASTEARGGHGRFDPAKMQERQARRQAELKQKLQLGAQQEGAWTAYLGATQHTRMQRPDRAEFARLTTPERIDRMRALRSARMAEMDKRADATKAFYAQLSPEQKKVFDAETARRGARDEGGHHGRHHKG